MGYIATVGYQLIACSESFAGTSLRAMEDEVSKKADAYIAMLQQSADMCEEGGVMLCSNSSSSSIFDQELHVS